MKEHVEMDAVFALQYSQFLFNVNVLFVKDLVPSDQVIKITCYSGCLNITIKCLNVTVINFFCLARLSIVKEFLYFIWEEIVNN